MGRGVNKQTLIGNVGTDPEVRFTANGLAVCTLRVACNEQKKVDDKWVDHVEWFSVVLWGKKAENAGQFLTKGSQIFVEGSSRMNKWKDKEGNERESREINCTEMTFLGGGRRRSDEKPKSNGAPRAQPSDGGGAPRDDLPF